MSYFPCQRCGFMTGVVMITLYPCACSFLDFFGLLHARREQLSSVARKPRRVEEGTALEPAVEPPRDVSFSALTSGAPKPPPKFKVGDHVRVVKIIPFGQLTSADLLGFEGHVTEVDDIVTDDGVRLQVNYHVDDRYMHEEELELVP